MGCDYARYARFDVDGWWTTVVGVGDGLRSWMPTPGFVIVWYGLKIFGGVLKEWVNALLLWDEVMVSRLGMHVNGRGKNGWDARYEGNGLTHMKIT